jgi:hypothetical protein
MKTKQNYLTKYNKNHLARANKILQNYVYIYFIKNKTQKIRKIQKLNFFWVTIYLFVLTHGNSRVENWNLTHGNSRVENWNSGGAAQPGVVQPHGAAAAAFQRSETLTG